MTLLLLLTLTSALAADDEHTIQAPFAARTVLGETHWQGGPIALAVGPCTHEACPVSLGHGPPDARRWVKVDDLSGAEDLTKAYEIRRAPPVEWMVSLSEYDRTSIAWRSVDDIAGHPTLEIHWQHGPEHVVDAWTLVSLIDGAPAVVWSYMPPPRYVGWTTYDVVSFQGTPLLVSQGFWRGEDGHPEELSRTFHRWNGKAFTRVDDIAPPVWLVIFGTTPTVEEAFALRDSAWCFLQAGVADSSAFPLLKPGRAVVAKAAADRATAERMLRKAKECAPDAYVKRGR